MPLERFREIVRTAFAQDARLRSALFLVAQYWDDSADDQVHGTAVFSRRPTPLWPHECAPVYDSTVGVEGDACDYCHRGELGERSWAYLSLQGLAAFCHEHASQDQDQADNFLPYAIARRDATSDDGIAIEIVGELQRPWLDLPATLEPTPPQDDEVRRLLALVYAQPHEDAPRRVLADLLQERGDPLGDYIALSFVDGASPDVRRERERLEATHGRAWLGPLQPVLPLSGAELARGFLHRARVHFADEAAVAEHGQHPEWATVERLRFSPGGLDHVDPVMRGLRKVGPLRQRGLLALAEAPAPWAIERLHARLESRGDETALACCDQLLPRLRRLRLSGAAVTTPVLATLAAAPFWPSLEHLAVSFAPGELAANVGAWIDRLDDWPTLPELELSTLTEALTVAGFRLTLRSDTPVVELGLAALASDATLAQLGDIVRALPPGTTLRLRATPLWTPGPEEIDTASTASGRAVPVVG